METSNVPPLSHHVGVQSHAAFVFCLFCLLFFVFCLLCSLSFFSSAFCLLSFLSFIFFCLLSFLSSLPFVFFTEIVRIQSERSRNIARISSRYSQNVVRSSWCMKQEMKSDDDHATMRESNLVWFFDSRLWRKRLVSLTYHQNWHPTAKLDPIG